MIRWCVCFLISSGTAVACEATGHPMMSDEEGAPDVYVSVDEIPLAQPFSMRITICSDAAVSEVNVDSMMPAHQHGLNYTPSVTALGANVFTVDGMLFHMPGEWELQVDVAAGAETISYTTLMALE